MTEPITIRRAEQVEDAYGDPALGAYTDHLTLDGQFAPSNPTEPVEVGRNAVITGGTVYIRDVPIVSYAEDPVPVDGGDPDPGDDVLDGGSPNPGEPVVDGSGAPVIVEEYPDVQSTDRAVIRGVEYEIDGEIGLWRRDASWGIQFAVTRAEG